MASLARSSLRLLRPTSRSCGHIKAMSTVEQPSDKVHKLKSAEKSSFFKRMVQKYVNKVSTKELKTSGFVLSTSCTQGVDLQNFFDYFDMPDTYFSWFLVTELHVWMLSTRLMAGKTTEGKAMRDAIVEALWEDSFNRMKRLADIPSKERRECVYDIAEEFRAALLVYDHGVIGDDKDLASALWRRFFICGLVDGVKLELLVKYVRQTLAMLDNTPISELQSCSKIDWLDLDNVNKSD